MGMIPHLEDKGNNLVIAKEKDVHKDHKLMVCGDKCVGCQLGKAHMQYFRMNPERATTIGHWHLDYKSSKVPSLYYGNTGYFIYFEEVSGVTCACPTNNKRGSTQLKEWKLLESLVEKYGHKTHTIVCDGGGEFINQETMDHWKVVKKYNVHVTVANTPQHNSRAERKIRTVDDKANACLQDYQLHDKYWELAILFVVYVENRILTMFLHNPPWTNLTGELVDYSVFSKDSSRKAYPGLFVGFPLDQKGILAHVPALGRIMAVIHYTVDYSINTKEHRNKIDWYGAKEWQGVLAEDADVELPIGGIGAVAPPSPMPATRGGIIHRGASCKDPPVPLDLDGDDGSTPRGTVPPTVSPPPSPPSAPLHAMSPITPMPYVPFAPTGQEGQTLGNTWSQEVGGYGPHFQVDTTHDMEAPVQTRSQVGNSSGLETNLVIDFDKSEVDLKTIPVITSHIAASSHVILQEALEADDPWKSDFDLIMWEVALEAKHGAENHYSSFKFCSYNSTSNVDSFPKGSKHPELLRLAQCPPKGTVRAINDPVFGHMWLGSCVGEIDNLHRNGTFVYLPLWKVQQMKQLDPNGISLNHCHFVFKVKLEDDGHGDSCLDKFKARLVYQGNMATQYTDWLKSHSPAVLLDTFKILIALMTIFDMYGFCGDFVAAFLQANLKEQHMYGVFPKGFKKVINGVEMCMHFKKNIYGMIQAARNFFLLIKDWFLDPNSSCPFKFEQLGSDQCVFTCWHNGHFMIVFLYVDDLVCLTTSIGLKVKLFEAISKAFEFEDKGELSYFLGMKITRWRSSRKTTLDMKAYIKDKLKLFKITDKKKTTTAYPTHDHEVGEELSGEEATLFRSMLGALIWVVVVRPDLCYSVSKLSKWMSKPHMLHLDIVKRAWMYLNTTLDDVLTFSMDGQDKESLLGVGFLHSMDSHCVATGYVDANLQIPKSTTGMLFKCAGATVIAKCKQQPVVSIATYDSEYYAMSSCFLMAIWLQMLFGELNPLFFKYFGKKLVDGPIVIHGDNNAVVRMVNEKAISTRSRHIQLRWHKMMEAVVAKDAEAHGISGKYNPADMYTKPQDGSSTTMWRLDLLGIKLVEKIKGVMIPPQVNWRPFISNYQSIFEGFVDMLKSDVFDMKTSEFQCMIEDPSSRA
jgi:hypothetical protein